MGYGAKRKTDEWCEPSMVWGQERKAGKSLPFFLTSRASSIPFLRDCSQARIGSPNAKNMLGFQNVTEMV